jgi:hypothetical protein
VNYNNSDVDYELQSSVCSVTLDDTTIVCATTRPGVGSGLAGRVCQAGQCSARVGLHTIGYTPPSITGVSMSVSGLSTSGSDTVTITGSNFGPTSTSASLIGGSYGPTASEVAFTSCSVTVNHSTVVCVSAPGVGAGHQVAISLAGQASGASGGGNTVSYEPPAITTLAHTPDVPTSGSAVVTITGTNFGPPTVSHAGTWTALGASLSGAYGPYTAASCSVTAMSTRVECVMGAGTGAGHAWTVVVDGQSSPASSDTVSYNTPSISSVAAVVDSATSGGGTVTLSGADFGGMGASASATYGPTGDTAKYTAASCAVTSPHTVVECVAAAGVGSNLRWVLTVDGLQSDVSTGSSAYAQATVTSLSPSSFSTAGTTVITVAGANFGPMSAGSVDVVYGDASSGYQYTALACGVTIAHTTLECQSEAGVGAHHEWRVSIQGVIGVGSGAGVTTSYAKPAITSISAGALSACVRV